MGTAKNCRVAHQLLTRSLGEGGRRTCRSQNARLPGATGRPPPLGGITAESSIPNSSMSGVEEEGVGWDPGSRS